MNKPYINTHGIHAFVHYRRRISRATIWDKLVFKKIQELIGGNVRLVFTASAPLEPKVLNFTRCAFGCVVNSSNINGFICWFSSRYGYQVAFRFIY